MGGFRAFFQGEGGYWAWRNFGEIRGEVDGYLRVGRIRHLQRISCMVAPGFCWIAPWSEPGSGVAGPVRTKLSVQNKRFS